MIYCIIIAMVLALVLIAYANIEVVGADERFSYDFVFGALVAILCCLFIMSFIFALDTDKPTAEDVINGKTSMKIIYVDGVPKDSTYVYKDCYKKEINWY